MESMQTYIQKLFEQGFKNLTTSIVNALKPLSTAMKPGLPAVNVNVGASASGIDIDIVNDLEQMNRMLVHQKLPGSVSLKAAIQTQMAVMKRIIVICQLAVMMP